MEDYTGTDVRRLRLEAGLTQGELAEKLDASQGLISAWETGRAPINGNIQKALRAIFGNAVQPQSNLFGDWLKRIREQQNLTVQELAERSNVSAPAIYNIESGRSANPRKSTMDRLAKALQSPVPSEIVESVNDDSQVKGLGSFTDFDPHNKEDLPVTAGVYVLYDISARPVYVGQGKSIGARIKDHHEKFWFKRPIVDTGSYIEIKDETLRLQVETLLIKFLKSNAVLNKQKVDRE